MTRFIRLLVCQLLLVVACHAQAAEGVEVTRANIEASDEGYKLAVAYSFDLSRGMEEAIQHGVPLSFTTEIELTRPRWYWTDDKAVSTRQTARIKYDVLTRQYTIWVSGSVQQSFGSLDEALFQIRRPSRWVIAPRGALKRGETYTVSLRMFMDRELLQKPLQVNAFNDSDWRLSSSKKTFTYRAD